jgi:fermentation-respiration switch protein FrsA (DUF1100 family)
MRVDIVFESCGTSCRGWLHVPEDLEPSARAPAIAMAHGLSGVKEMFLSCFAERFCAEGFVTLVFDFRNLGESDGEPRGQIFPYQQHEDYRNAISWLSRRPEVDSERIGVWGTSFSGGHVMHLAAFDRRIRAAVAQVPAIAVWRQILHAGQRAVLDGMLGLVAADRAARFQGGAVNHLKVVAPTGEPCILGTPDAYEWFQKHGERFAATWRNAVTIESLEKMIEYDPANAIELVAPTPLLLIAARHDSLIPVELVQQAFERAGEPKRLELLDCGHFDVYNDEPWFSRAAGAASDWFKSHLCSAE